MFRRMAIEINENVLLTIAGVIFVPIFVFLIKMIMEVANIRTKLDAFESHIEETKVPLKKISDFGYELRAIKTALADIDGDLRYLFNSVHHDSSSNKSELAGGAERFGSRRQFRQKGTAKEEEGDENGKQ